MTSPRKLAMILCMTLLVANMWAVPNVEEVTYSCHEHIEPLSDYQGLVEIVSSNLIKRTATRSFNFYDEETMGDLTSYGHGICRPGISGDDCMTCMHVVNVHRIMKCGFVFGSRVTLQDCHMRIDDIDFKWDAAESIF